MLSPTRLILGACLLAALGLRVAALLSLEGGVYFDHLLSDERLYHEWAKRIADGTFTSNSVYAFAPLPAYVMAALYKVFGANILWVRLANNVWGTVTCFLAYFIGKELGGKRAGLITCGAAALYGQFVLYSVVPLKTSLSLLLFSGVILSLLIALRRIESAGADKKSLLSTLVLGAAIGLAVNVRANYAVVAPVVVIFIAGTNWKRPSRVGTAALLLTTFFVGIGVAVSPFVIRNYNAAGRLALTTSQTGRNLYFGNNLTHDDPYYRPLPFASSLPDEQAIQFVVEASRRSGRVLDEQETSRFWTREVLATASREPGRFVAKLGRKILVFFNRFEAGDHYHIDFLADHVSVFKMPFLGLAWILPLGMAGMLVRVRRCRKTQALAAVFLLYALTLIAFVTNTRYRLPMLVMLTPFAVTGAMRFAQAIKNRDKRHLAIFGSLVLAFIAIELLPIRGTWDMTSYYNSHALALQSAGRTDDAIQYWEASSALNGAYSPVANLFLSGKYYERGARDKAIETINKIDNTSYAASPKHTLLGDLYVHEGRHKEAIAAYEKSLEINSGQRRIRKELIKLYSVTNPTAAAEQASELNRINRFFRADD